MKYYAFTIRRTNNPHSVSVKNYDDFLRNGLYKSQHHHDTTYTCELESGLHIHGTSAVHETVKNINHFYRLLKPKKGWNIKVTECDDGWDPYTTKNQLKYKTLLETLKEGARTYYVVNTYNLFKPITPTTYKSFKSKRSGKNLTNYIRTTKNLLDIIRMT